MNDCPRDYECDGCVFKGTMDCALEDEELFESIMNYYTGEVDGE